MAAISKGLGLPSVGTTVEGKKASVTPTYENLPDAVVVRFSHSEVSHPFHRFVHQMHDDGKDFIVEELLVLQRLMRAPTLSLQDAMHLTQRGKRGARAPPFGQAKHVLRDRKDVAFVVRRPPRIPHCSRETIPHGLGAIDETNPTRPLQRRTPRGIRDFQGRGSRHGGKTRQGRPYGAVQRPARPGRSVHRWPLTQRNTTARSPRVCPKAS